MLERMIERLADLRPDAGRPAKPRLGPILHGWAHLPLTFRPGRRVFSTRS